MVEWDKVLKKPGVNISYCTKLNNYRHKRYNNICNLSWRDQCFSDICQCIKWNNQQHRVITTFVIKQRRGISKFWSYVCNK